MPGLIQELLSGNFSSPLSWVFVIFTLLAFFFLFRLAWIFFVQGDTFTESVEGRRQDLRRRDALPRGGAG